MHGIVCVERLGVTRTIRVGVPKTPAEADAPVCTLPSTVRVHAIIRTRSQYLTLTHILFYKFLHHARKIHQRKKKSHATREDTQLVMRIILVTLDGRTSRLEDG